ncbi:hypothetical protein D081_2022 [Anaerovibrio sp. JC8]|uniref:hypothetical protein n=1 Tax=Anaerovibrio sp. JC8 TaxID=1240085 RepID=UPI000A0C6E9B|nr:hypothetical protein [Anaerovibrio sp. JC8]ORT99293.1 hypothetical protein D081_2022 [Anaerovibrio sp. JC8]
MISNPAINDKIEEKAGSNIILKDFLYAIISHENESVQFSKQYKKLIEKAVDEKVKN